MSICTRRVRRLSEIKTRYPRIYTARIARTNRQARESSIFDEQFNDYPVSKFNSSCRDDEAGAKDLRVVDLAQVDLILVNRLVNSP